MKQIQARILRTRSSTLKPLKQTSGSHSPPPKQLFTATKQSSLNDFFHVQQGMIRTELYNIIRKYADNISFKLLHVVLEMHWTIMEF